MELVQEINNMKMVYCSQNMLEKLDFNWTTQSCRELFMNDQVEFHRICVMLAFAYKEYLFTFLFDSVFMGSLCLAGATGNVISILVLSHDYSRATKGANILLRGLCAVDTGFLVVYFFYSSLRYVFPLTGLLRSYYHYFPMLVRYLWTIAMTTQMAANWIVVLVTVERYTAVWQPFNGVKWRQTGRSRVACLVALLTAVLFNIPRLFEWEVVTTPTATPCTNYTSFTAVDSALRKNPVYSLVYRLLLYTVCVAAGPLALLGFMNFRLIRALRRASRDHIALTLLHHRHHRMSPLPTTGGGVSGVITPPCFSPVIRRDRSRNVTICIVVIVCVFFVCETPALIHQILAAAGVHFPVEIQIYSVTLSNGLVVIKSSVNFLIYCMCGRKFRLLFRRLLRRRGFRLPSLPRQLASWIREIQEQIRTSIPHPLPSNGTADQFPVSPEILENIGRRDSL